eukprot:5013747-Pyramimonas_sp.AAC.1
MRFSSASLWRLIMYNPWGARGIIDNIAQTGANHLTNELKELKKDNPEQATCTTNRITIKMMGDWR